MFLIVFAVYAIFMAGICAWLASQKNRDPVAWGVLGFLSGIFSLLALGFAPVGTHDKTKQARTLRFSERMIAEQAWAERVRYREARELAERAERAERAEQAERAKREAMRNALRAERAEREAKKHAEREAKETKRMSFTSTVPPSKPEIIQYPCPNCRKILAIPGEYAGQKGKCNKCGHFFLVPSTDKLICANRTTSTHIQKERSR